MLSRNIYWCYLIIDHDDYLGILYDDIGIYLNDYIGILYDGISIDHSGYFGIVPSYVLAYGSSLGMFNALKMFIM